MRIYGLTGGTGSGKTEVAKRLADFGIPVIDADKIGHELIAPGGAAEQDVLDAFGHEILTDERIDRSKLGPIVFSDPEALGRLNAITHPLIRAEVTRRCEALRAREHQFAVLDAALLAEDGKLPARLAGLIVVTCSREIRLQRLVEARGLSRESAEARMDSQTPPEEKVALADWVIHNEGTLEDLSQRVKDLVAALREHAP